MNGWENFAIAQVGASAALAGLVLVGVSVNLERVLDEPSAPPRVADVEGGDLRAADRRRRDGRGLPLPAA